MSEKNYSNSNIEHLKIGEFEYIKFRILQPYEDKLKCFTTLRHGGKSVGNVASLNFRLVGKDKLENVFKNVDVMCENMNIQRQNIVKAMQAHTDKILVLTNYNKEKYEFNKISKEKYDGYVYNQKNIASVITTADCNPIIIYDKEKNIVANVHSGWLGTTKRIYLNALKIMIDQFGTNPSDVIVCIGPAIQKCCWSSRDKELKSNFLRIWSYENEYITTRDNDEFFVDFPYVITKDFIEYGVLKNNIVSSNICTRCNRKDFFSYRYTTQNKLDDFGVMVTVAELL